MNPLTVEQRLDKLETDLMIANSKMNALSEEQCSLLLQIRQLTKNIEELKE